jgi:hypothetical protein
MTQIINAGRFNAFCDFALTTEIIVTVVDNLDGGIYNAAIGADALKLDAPTDCAYKMVDVAIDGQYQYSATSQNALFSPTGMHVRFEVVTEDNRHYFQTAKTSLRFVTSRSEAFAQVADFK